MTPLPSLIRIGPPLAPETRLRVSWIAAHLGVSTRWVHYAMRPPAKRPDGKCKGIPHLPSRPHPTGGRCVLVEDYVVWLGQVDSALGAGQRRAS